MEANCGISRNEKYCIEGGGSRVKCKTFETINNILSVFLTKDHHFPTDFAGMRRRKSWKLEVINSQKWAVVGCAEIFRWGFPPATAARWHTGNLWLRTFGKRPFSWHPIISNHGGRYLILLTNFQNFLSISMLNEHWGDMQEFAKPGKEMITFH